MRGLRAGQRAAAIASLCGPGFERAQQGTADAAEACFRRNVIQGDFTGIRHRAYGEDGVALGGEQQRVSVLADPGGDDVRFLVGQPRVQDCGIVAMIGDT